MEKRGLWFWVQLIAGMMALPASVAAGSYAFYLILWRGRLSDGLGWLGADAWLTHITHDTFKKHERRTDPFEESAQTGMRGSAT
jgi:hypothetical protein